MGAEWETSTPWRAGACSRQPFNQRRQDHEAACRWAFSRGPSLLFLQLATLAIQRTSSPWCVVVLSCQNRHTARAAPRPPAQLAHPRKTRWPSGRGAALVAPIFSRGHRMGWSVEWTGWRDAGTPISSPEDSTARPSSINLSSPAACSSRSIVAIVLPTFAARDLP